MSDRLSCEAVDELAGAWGLDALPPDEASAVAEHLNVCDREHAELRGSAEAGATLAASLSPEVPSPELRVRIMNSIAAAPQGSRPTTAPAVAQRTSSRWLMPAIGGLATAAVLVLGIWNVQLQGDLERRDAQLAELASAISDGGVAYRASGSAGSGYLIDATHPLLVAALPEAPSGSLYELWLLDADGTPVAVGTVEAGSGDGVVITELERPLSGYSTFAITVEEERVEQPRGPIVLAAELSG